MARVLLADNNPDHRNVYGGVLRTHGLEVIEATDGHQALAKAIEFVPDVVLLDIAMPGMNGIEVAQALSSNQITGEIPVVAISGLDTEQIRRDALNAGCVTYLAKPYSPLALIAEAMHWVARGRRTKR
jgi:two-component system, cell cycle response regulator DivK